MTTSPFDWRRRATPRPGRRRVRIAVLAVLASITVLLLDSTGGAHSPLSPIRSAIGTLAGPLEKAANAVASPFADLGGYFHTNSSLRSEISRLQAQNAQLQGQTALTQLERSRIAEVDALTGLAKSTGYTLLSAHVIAIGSAQSFARTMTIDAGTSSGVHADLTVVDSGGLVGRVVSATSTTATVLLITDPTSVVGGRLGSNLQLGTVTGESNVESTNTLDFELSDSTASIRKGATITTWGSPNGIPYVAGIPIGTVTGVTSTPRDLSVHMSVKPFARFGSLDIVGVVVPANTTSSRPLIRGTAG
ncbi:MAG: rod shape-determining protein MreC [Marmoricola sp.]